MINVIIGNNTRLEFVALNNNLFTSPFHQWPTSRRYREYPAKDKTSLLIQKCFPANMSTEPESQLVT